MKGSALALVLVCSLLGCRHKDEPPASHGFAPVRPQDPPTAAEIAKLNQQQHASHYPDRPQPPSATFAFYVDGKATRTVASNEMEPPLPLRTLLGKLPARTVLAHAEAGDWWFTPDKFDQIELRLNRRGQVKLAVAGGGGGNGGGGGGNGGGGNGGGGGAMDLRGVQWLEARTSASARLADEP